MNDSAGEQQDPGTNLNDEVAHTGPVSGFSSTRPDKEYRCDCGSFPVNKQRNEVAGKGTADCGTGIYQSRHLLDGVFDMERKNNADCGGYMEYIAKDKAQTIDPHWRKCVTENVEGEMNAFRNDQKPPESDNR